MTLPERDFVLIRHGQTDANRDGIIAGRLEALLTEKGRDGAARLAGVDWPKPIKLFVSPQQRAQETARLAFPDHRVITLEALRERDWGRFEGRSTTELPPRESTPEGGEGWAEITARVSSVLAECHALAGNALPVIVSHSGVIRAVRFLAFGEIHAPSAANTTPYLYQLRDGRWTERQYPLKDLT